MVLRLGLRQLDPGSDIPSGLLSEAPGSSSWELGCLLRNEGMERCEVLAG